MSSRYWRLVTNRTAICFAPVPLFGERQSHIDRVLLVYPRISQHNSVVLTSLKRQTELTRVLSYCGILISHFFSEKSSPFRPIFVQCVKPLSPPESYAHTPRKRAFLTTFLELCSDQRNKARQSARLTTGRHIPKTTDRRYGSPT